MAPDSRDPRSTEFRLGSEKARRSERNPKPVSSKRSSQRAVAVDAAEAPADADVRVEVSDSLEFENQELVRLHTTIGQTRALGEERMVLALQINARLAHGALALRDGELVMIDTLMLKDADPAEVEASLSYLALTADYYEKMLFGTDDH